MSLNMRLYSPINTLQRWALDSRIASANHEMGKTNEQSRGFFNNNSCIMLPILLTSCDTLSWLNKGSLSQAIFSNNLKGVKEAVDNGADANKGSFSYALHEVPLLYSMRKKSQLISEYLLSEGASPNYIDRNNGISLLMYAIGARPEGGIHYSGLENSDFYKILLNDERTDVNLTGKLGYTALDYACRDNGQWDHVNDLINHGATITNTTMTCAYEGYKKGQCEESVIKLIFDYKEGWTKGQDTPLAIAQGHPSQRITN